MAKPEWWPFEGDAPDVIWCLHCERAFALENAALDKQGYGECPHCGAGAMDFWDWERIRGLHADYPEVPEGDTVYPQYRA